MFSIQDSCSLDISVDLDSHKIICGNNVRQSSFDRVKLSSILPSLLNKSLSYPEDVYDVYKKVFSEEDQNIADSDISYDLMLLPAGLLGIEFVKTHIYNDSACDSHKLSCIIEVQYGVLTIIMQKNKIKCDTYDFETYVEEGLLVKLKKGEKLTIPNGYFYTFINTDEIPVVFVRVYRKEGIADYNLLRRERGLAYYCIRKNAKQEIVLNPAYRNTPKIKDVPSCEVNQIQFDIPLYQALKEEIQDIGATLFA